MIYNYIKHFLYYIPIDTVGELLDDVFMRVYSYVKTLKDPTSFKRWIFQIAHNVCVNYIKKKRMKSISDEHLEQIPDQRIDVEANYIKKEFREFIFNEVSNFDDKTREIIILKFFQNMTYEEISKIIKLSVRKCKYKMKKAYLELNFKIKKKGYSL